MDVELRNLDNKISKMSTELERTNIARESLKAKRDQFAVVIASLPIDRSEQPE